MSPLLCLVLTKSLSSYQHFFFYFLKHFIRLTSAPRHLPVLPCTLEGLSRLLSSLLESQAPFYLFFLSLYFLSIILSTTAFNFICMSVCPVCLSVYLFLALTSLFMRILSTLLFTWIFRKQLKCPKENSSFPSPTISLLFSNWHYRSITSSYPT